MSKTGEKMRAKITGLDAGSGDHFYRDVEGKQTDRQLLVRLAQLMGWYVFGENEPVFAEVIQEKAPCAIQDGPDDFPMLLVYDYIEQVDILHGDGKTERAIYGRHWNPLGEIHDAWEVLEAFQKRETPMLLDPQVFGVPGQMAARVISLTALDAAQQKTQGVII